MKTPRVGPAARSVVALTLACTVCWLTGCGGDEDPAADTTKVEVVRTATPTPTPERNLRIRITRPKPGTLVRGAELVRGGFAATVKVAGVAAPDTTVLLDGGCFRTGCNATARADEDGRWRGRVLVTGTQRSPAARISVLTPVSDPLDVVRVRLEAPEPAPKPPTSVRTAEREAEPTAQPARARPTRVPPRRLVLVGDSLAVGIRDLLPRALPDWSVSVDARTGRRLAEGMGIVAGADVSSVPSVLAVSLFTNDDPGNVPALEQAVRDTVARAGAQGCAVWATIVRPPLNGVSYGAANARLQALDAELGGRLVLVPWAATVAGDPRLMGPDGVHPTPAGYQVRARLYAQAAQSCGA